jgi:putative tricarboxylic transport membrane protein
MRERGIAAGLLGFALGYALLASGYTVSFVADPLGPRAAPFLLATLLVLLSLWILAYPPQSEAASAAPHPRSMAAVVGLALYAALMPWLGFVLATALLTAALARLAQGPPVRAAALGTAFAAVLYYLFVFALDVPLPIGRIFPFLGG